MGHDCVTPFRRKFTTYNYTVYVQSTLAPAHSYIISFSIFSEMFACKRSEPYGKSVLNVNCIVLYCNVNSMALAGMHSEWTNHSEWVERLECQWEDAHDRGLNIKLTYKMGNLLMIILSNFYPRLPVLNVERGSKPTLRNRTPKWRKRGKKHPFFRKNVDRRPTTPYV